MEQKPLFGVESVHNQVSDTASVLVIRRTDLTNDNGHLVFGVSSDFNP